MKYLTLIRWKNILILETIMLLIVLLFSQTIEISMIQYMIGVGLIFASGNIINDIKDLEVDKINNKENVVHEIGTKRAFNLYLTLNTIGLVISPNLGTTLLFASCIILLWLYSNRFQQTFLIGNLIICVLTSVSILWLLKLGIDNPNLIFFSILCGGVQLLREIVKDTEDMNGDEKVGYKTLPISLGIKRTKNTLYILTSITIIGIAYVQWEVYPEGWNWPLLAVVYLLLVFMGKLQKAGHKTHYTFLTKLLKLTIIAGTLSLFFF